jgi:hypothetical protein
VDRDTFVFPHGTLSSMVTKQVDQMTPLNACTVALKMAGTFQINGGTGAYQERTVAELSPSKGSASAHTCRVERAATTKALVTSGALTTGPLPSRSDRRRA